MEKSFIPHTELTAVKLKRRSIDQEAQMLQNKILLLKHAQTRAHKSNERKKRIAEISTEARMNKLEKLENQERLKKLRDQEELKRVQLAQKNREKNKSFKDSISRFLFNKAHNEAESTKKDHQRNKLIIEAMKKAELEKKKIFSLQVKRSVQQAKSNRKVELDEKINKVKNETQMKIAEEFSRIKEKERCLERLEREQLQLIERLNFARHVTSSEGVQADRSNQISFKYKMDKRTEFLKVVAEFLIKRCEGLGYLPMVTKTCPSNRSFGVQPGQNAVFVKVFGHFNHSLNTVHGRFAVLDPDHMKELGSLGDDNLCLTKTEKFLLVSQITLLSTESIERLLDNLHNLDDIYETWLKHNKLNRLH